MFKDWTKPSLKIEVKCAVLHTMVFEPDLLNSLFQIKIPITVFVERKEKGSPVDKVDQVNMNIVYPQKTGWGVFHSKLILYEFDDRLRVIISSANLYRHDWEHMSQVIWVQDFPAKSVLSDGVKESSNDFA